MDDYSQHMETAMSESSFQRQLEPQLPESVPKQRHLQQATFVLESQINSGCKWSEKGCGALPEC